MIVCGAEIIARHQRSYAKADLIFDPRHYLELLERKIAALDQAAPLQNRDLPDEFATLRRLLESRVKYPSILAAEPYLRPIVKIECGARGALEPAGILICSRGCTPLGAIVLARPAKARTSMREACGSCVAPFVFQFCIAALLKIHLATGKHPDRNHPASSVTRQIPPAVSTPERKYITRRVRPLGPDR